MSLGGEWGRCLLMVSFGSEWGRWGGGEVSFGGIFWWYLLVVSGGGEEEGRCPLVESGWGGGKNYSLYVIP